ncbi:condensation domain-containing protein, partial [Streptacidiphilus sp. EB129]|uniref:condensation domain-containing protein n=1 Tax=Streptacidiphilus sp. EB129 TaxID=3156262 RepID=UPI003518FBEC
MTLPLERPVAAEPGSPLSFGQEQLWFLDQLAPGETTYNLLLAWRLRGALDVGILRRCLALVVERHEVLRVTVRAVNGTPYQVVAPAGEVELTIVDLGGLTAEEQQAAVDAAIADQTNQPFDLETGPLYRYRLYRLADDDYVFCQGFHHLVTDGWSSAVMNAEITAAYQALLTGEDPVFDDLEMDYPEFADWQRQRLQGEELEEELTFWQEKLADLPVLELPTDRPRPAVPDHSGATVIRHFPPELLDRARATAQEHGVSLFMVLAAAFTTVLSRYSGQEDIPVGVPMLGRVEPELEDVVGLFINMVVLRSDLSGDPSFSEFLERTADANLELYEHQEVPFHQVVDRVQPVREP